MDTNLKKTGFGGRVLARGESPAFDEANNRYSDAAILVPEAIIFPTSVVDISLAIQYTQTASPPIPVAVKGGGCSTSAVASIDNGVVIDLSNINHVRVSEDRKIVAVGGGAVWGDVYSALEAFELAVVGAAVWLVGV